MKIQKFSLTRKTRLEIHTLPLKVAKLCSEEFKALKEKLARFCL